jgi:hypothetical protein
MRTVSVVLLTEAAAALFNISPLSPEAASLGGVGNIRLRSITTWFKFSVPLHEIKIGRQSQFIGITY